MVIMAKVEFDESFGIKSMSGAFSRKRLLDGSVVVTFFTKKGRMYTRTYKRTAPPSANEQAARSLFSLMSREVTRRINGGDKRLRSEIWAEVKREMNPGGIPEASRKHLGGNTVMMKKK